MNPKKLFQCCFSYLYLEDTSKNAVITPIFFSTINQGDKEKCRQNTKHITMISQLQ